MRHWHKAAIVFSVGWIAALAIYVGIPAYHQLTCTPTVQHLPGGTIIEQGETACCYAKSEKSWIDDPAGISWETFHTTGESIDYGDGTGERNARVAHEKACCTPQQSAAPAVASACCK